jgi:hypothetical protein
MSCTRAEELLADYCAGDLAPGPLRSELEAHLAACPTCRALSAALDDVLALLRAARDPLSASLLEPPPGLAERAAGAALRAGRSAGRAWGVLALPRRVQVLAASLALLATGVVWAGHGAFDRQWPQRTLRRAATAGVRLIERKDRAVEELRVLRVMVSATFSGRMDQVSERVDDYRRLLERRRTAPPASPESTPSPESRPRPQGSAAPGPPGPARPVSWAGEPTQSPNRGALARV